MVKPLWVGVQRVLPLVYDDTLSYYETLCKVVWKLNEVIQAYNGHDAEIKAYINSLLYEFETKWLQRMNERLEEMQKQVNDSIDENNQQIREQYQLWMGLFQQMIDAAQAQMTSQFRDQDAKFNRLSEDLQHKVNDQLSANKMAMDQLEGFVNQSVADLTEYINSQFSTLNKLINAGNKALRDWFQAQLDELRREIPEVVEIPVVNPVTGKIATIQEVLNDLWDRLRYLALSVVEYASLHLTVAEYTAIYMTVYDYDVWGWKYLYFHNPCCNIHDPWTGEWVGIAPVIFRLAQLHRTGGITANDYDVMEFPAARYDEEGFTAYFYDWEIA